MVFGNSPRPRQGEGFRGLGLEQAGREGWGRARARGGMAARLHLERRVVCQRGEVVSIWVLGCQYRVRCPGPMYGVQWLDSCLGA